MMKHSLLVFALIGCWSVFGIGQQRHCGVNDLLNAVSEETRQKFTQLSDQTNNQAQSREQVVLPVVIHVVYFEEEANISDFQIKSQMEVINEAFDGLYELSPDVLESHKAVISSPNIRFELACTDPDGNPTTGITRTETNIENIGFYTDFLGRYAIHHTAEGGKDPWPTSDYINIWVAEMDESLLGRASLPFILPDPNQDGVVIASRNFGYAGLAAERQPYHLGRTLVHELGHYLGLNHTWGQGEGSCNIDDGVSDTPDQSEIYYDCPSETNSESCGSIDMTKNFMGYTDDECLLYFTQGQVNRMMNTLNGFRAALLNSPALINCESTIPTSSEFLIWNRIDAREFVIQFSSEFVEPSIDIAMYNMKGQQVEQASMSKEEITHLSYQSLPAGAYVIIFSSDEIIEQRRVIVY